MSVIFFLFPGLRGREEREEGANKGALDWIIYRYLRGFTCFVYFIFTLFSFYSLSRFVLSAFELIAYIYFLSRL